MQEIDEALLQKGEEEEADGSDSDDDGEGAAKGDTGSDLEDFIANDGDEADSPTDSSGGEDTEGKTESTDITEAESNSLADENEEEMNEEEEEAAAPALEELEASDAKVDAAQPKVEESAVSAEDVEMAEEEPAVVEEPNPAPAAAESTEWACSSCTFMNPEKKKTCQMCQSKRSKKAKRN